MDLRPIEGMVDALKDIWRVLAPGGRFCLGHEPNEAFFASRGLAGATLGGAVALAIGLGLQNLPEGLAVAIDWPADAKAMQATPGPLPIRCRI